MCVYTWKKTKKVITELAYDAVKSVIEAVELNIEQGGEDLKEAFEQVSLLLTLLGCCIKFCIHLYTTVSTCCFDMHNCIQLCCEYYAKLNDCYIGFADSLPYSSINVEFAVVCAHL